MIDFKIKFQPIIICLSLIVSVSFFSPAYAANDKAGLWVGTASVNGISRVNKATPDLSFDLVLAGDGSELIPAGAEDWKYTAPANPAHVSDATQEPYKEPDPDTAGNTWSDLDYDASNWQTGKAEFGFGDNDENSKLNYNTPTWPRTIYFRKTFTPTTTEAFENLTLQLLVDDGAVVYCNGVEILRKNMPTGIIDYSTSPETAIGPSDEGRFIVEEIYLPDHPGLILQDTAITENVIAVEIHQHPGELRNPNLEEPSVSPSAAEFNIRIMLHIDTEGRIKLLKEVYRMNKKVDNDIFPVLLATDELIPNFIGPGSRISTAAYDFEGSTVSCIGSASETGQITCDFVLAPNHPTNPFLHRYHPDHDNWDPRYEKHFPEAEGAPEESFKVERTMKFTFESKYPPGCEGEACQDYPPPSWGYSSMGGTYTEILRGLHRDDITVTGTFKLDRVSTVSKLEE